MLTRPSVAASKYNLALLRRQRNETDIARQLFRECEQIYFTVYGPDHSEQCTDLTTARRWMQHGKLVVVCSDPAQITKISNTTKENTFAFLSLLMVKTLVKLNKRVFVLSFLKIHVLDVDVTAI